MRQIRHFRAPDEPERAERTWRVVAAAFAEREPVHARRVPLRAFVAAAVVAGIAATAVTAPGRAVITSVRDAIGVEHAHKTFTPLPGGGSLLVGGWIVHGDGSTRRLGDYGDTSWSPFGRYVVAAGADRLLALTPDGKVRWTLGQPVVNSPRWAGTPNDTRIAYLSGQRLRVVAGDGTGDHAVGATMSAPIAPAWRPAKTASALVLSYADTEGRIRALAPSTGRLLFRTPRGPRPLKIAWSADGSRLLVLRAHRIDVYDARGKRIRVAHGHIVDAAFLPGSSRVVVLRRSAAQSWVALLGSRGSIFRITGTLRQVVPSPNGKWLLLTWPAVDQWLFVRAGGSGRALHAVGNIAEQLGGRFPVEGWTSGAPSSVSRP